MGLPPGRGLVRIGLVAVAATTVAIATDVNAPSREGFSLGVLGPFTIWEHGAAAGAVAFDLDLRKNFEPAMQARFGPPIIEIPNIHPGLRNLTIQLGTTHGSSSIGLKTAIDWFQGTGGSDQFVGIVGAVFSSISMPVASNAAVFEVPQISYASSNPALSDKQSYPYFSRVASPDNFRAKAVWAWKVHFQVPSLAVLFQGDSYGTGFYEAMRGVAQEAGALDEIIAVQFENMDAASFDMEIAKEAWSRVMASGTKFVLLVFPLLRPQMLYVLEQEGLLYSLTYQFMTPEDQSLGQGNPSPSRGFPIGYQVIASLAKGPKFSAFEELWGLLTPEDLYSQDARQRYNLDAMKMPFSSNSALAVTNATFTPTYFTRGVWPLAVRIFDAAYCLAIAINNLLNNDVARKDIRGRVLLEEQLRMDFPGTSGRISFDENGDIRADHGLFSSAAEGTSPVQMGTVNPSTGAVVLFDIEAGGLMWANGAMNTTVPRSLFVCEPGQQWNAVLGRCSSCSDGFISSGGQSPKCESCPAGTTSNAEATSCTDCRSGWFNELPGGTCSRCAPGKYSGEPGASLCSECDVGTFSEQLGATACRLCGEGHTSQAYFTTMKSLVVGRGIEYLYVSGADSSKFCVCDRGTRNSSFDECITCDEGLLCEGMGSVLMEEGYYAAEDLSIYRCYGDQDRCPGGPPGDCCAEGRQALGCAECEDGKTPGSNGGCIECNNSDKAPFALAMFLIVGCLTVAYCIIDNDNRATQSHALLICTFALSQFVTTVQQMGVIGMLSFEWKDPLRTFLQSLSLLTLNFEVLRLGCVAEVKPLLVYLFKVLAIFAILLVVVLIHGVVVGLRHKGQFSKRFPVLVAAFGTVYMVCYISVTSAVMEPLQCLSHPNGKWTVREYPSIICWETGEHVAMMVLGTIMFVIVPLGFIAGTCFIVREFPKRLRRADSRSVRAFSFLFFRFRPGCHTYVVAFVLRSFMVALVLVVPDLLVQVFLLIWILLAGFAVILLWLPWRVLVANVLEAVLTCTTLVLVALGVAFIPEEDKEPETIADVAMVAIMIGLLFVPCVVGYGLWRRFFRYHKPYEFFLCHYKVGSGAWTRLLKFHLIDSRKVKTDVFIDSDNLDHLDHLFNYVGNDTGTLVVVGTLGIFQRPWCLGEMCTAQLKGVPTVLLSLPNFQLPEESFVLDLRSGVNNLEMLIESGMAIETLQSTLRWISTVPRIIVPPVVSVPLMDSVAGALYGKLDKEAITTINVHPEKAAHGKMVGSAIICDQSDTEALAAAWILKRTVTAFLTDEPESIPTVVDQDVISDRISMALVICKNTSFTRITFLELLVKCTSPRLLPIIAETGFQIPGKGFQERLKADLPNTADDLQHAIAITVSALFKKIGANFEAGNASESVLQASAADIAKQIKSWGMVSTNSAGELPRGSTKSPGSGGAMHADSSENPDERRVRNSSTSRTTLSSSGLGARPSHVQLSQQTELQALSTVQLSQQTVSAVQLSQQTDHQPSNASRPSAAHNRGSWLLDL